MYSMHRITSAPMQARLGWVAALWARLERTFARTAPPPPRAEVPEPAEPPTRAHAVASGLQVLVVDDDPAHLEDASALLERCGVAALMAVDGLQAVALARVHDFDLILMDLQMPVLDGLAATMQIRARETVRSRPRAPVLAYTSVAVGDDLLRACGIDGVLAKPCSVATLQECLRRWCTR